MATRSSVLAWGSSGLVDSDSDMVPLPKQVPDPVLGEGWVNSAAFGLKHGAVVLSSGREDGVLMVWGDNQHGQLGKSNPRRIVSPVRVDALELFNIIGVSCGDSFTVVVTSCGKALSFGLNNFQQLGHSFDKTQSAKPKLVNYRPFNPISGASVSIPKVVSASCGSKHTLLLTRSGNIWAFGDNSGGQIGMESKSTISGAYLIRSLSSFSFKKVAAGANFSLALTISGSVFSWGFNTVGQLGHGNKFPSLSIPTRIAKLSNIMDISCGGSHCAAIDAKGTCFVWGSGSHGQTASISPGCNIPIPLISMDGCDFGPIESVVCGKTHTVVTAKRRVGDGSDNWCLKLYSFGSNRLGQLGVGNRIDRNSPSLVLLPNILSLDIPHVVYAGWGEQMILVSGLNPSKLKSDDLEYGLSLVQVKKLVREIDADSSDRAGSLLVAKLRQVFGSFALLNASFLTVDYVTSIGPLNPAISLSDVRECFQLLANIQNEKWGSQVKMILKEAIHNMPLSISSEKISTSNPENLRAFLILLENPFNLPEKHSLTAITKLGSAFERLKQDQKLILGKWWSHNPSLLENYRLAVRSFNSALSYYTLARINPPTIMMLNLLQWLWTVNNTPFVDNDPLQFSHMECTSLSALSKPPAPVPQEHSPTENPFVTSNYSAQSTDTRMPPITNRSLPSTRNSQAQTNVMPPSNSSPRSFMSSMGTLRGTPAFSIEIDARHVPINPETGQPSMPHLARLAAQAFTSQMESLLKTESPNIVLGARPSPKSLIPHAEFVNEALSARIDFKKDFMSYYASLRPQVFGNNRASGSEGHFSFCKFPFAFTLSAKADLLMLDSQRQMMEMQSMSLVQHLQTASAASDPSNTNFPPPPRADSIFNTLGIRRKHLLKDAFERVDKMSAFDLKRPLKVKFLGEMGVDGGGVSREFIALFFRRLTRHSDMFEDVDLSGSAEHQRGRGYIWFNPLSSRPSAAYKTVGRVMGMALFNGCFSSVSFPCVLFKRLLGWPATLDDLASLQPYTAKWLREMLSHTDKETFSEAYYGMEFSVTIKTRKQGSLDPLIEPYKNVNLPGPYGGKAVTFENRGDYVNAMVHWHTGGHVEDVLKAFRIGFLEACSGPVLDQLLPQQLETMIAGKNAPEVNFKDLEKVCTYKEPYSKSHPVIKRFWSVFHALPEDFKFKFLKFITGTDTIPPIKGLKEVILVIQPSGGGASDASNSPENPLSTTTGAASPSTSTPAAIESAANVVRMRGRRDTTTFSRFAGDMNASGRAANAVPFPNFFGILSNRSSDSVPVTTSESSSGNLPGSASHWEEALREQEDDDDEEEDDDSDSDYEPTPDEYGSPVSDFELDPQHEAMMGILFPPSLDEIDMDEMDDDEEDDILYDAYGHSNRMDSDDEFEDAPQEFEEPGDSSGITPHQGLADGGGESESQQIQRNGDENIDELAGTQSNVMVTSSRNGGRIIGAVELNLDHYDFEDGDNNDTRQSESGPHSIASGSGSRVIGDEAPDMPASRGTKRHREAEENENEVDDWEGHVVQEDTTETQTSQAQQMDSTSGLQSLEVIQAQQEKGKHPAHKKSRLGKSPMKATVQSAAQSSSSNWWKDVVLDTSLNESSADVSIDESRLPVAHTCSFVLDLPAYQTVEKLMDRLVYAVENSGEFHLV
ncbi:putative E3 ubiquitin-protein ligase herc4 [Chytriomyces hyalinus]|nr:putative E3 ubiquitin-protein ligase herc4 [Chytriomyces hyalinus]